MTPAQDTVVAIRKGGERLVIANLHADAYPEASFTVDPEQVPAVQRHCCGMNDEHEWVQKATEYSV